MRLRPVVAAASLSALFLAAPAVARLPENAGGPLPAPRIERLEVPLRGPIFERFGYARGRLHAGIDIAVLGTDAVRAAAAGVVTAVGYVDGYAGYGNVVKIRHPDGRATMYAHLASASVRAGERVGGGELIGRAGCTGSCTGPHLHFELRIRGRLVDPLRFLPKELR